ncbi:MAG: permease-like cell division protein FtsX [Bacteroidota bacterium]
MADFPTSFPDSFLRKRSRSAMWATVPSMGLSLFLLGMFGTFFLFVGRLSQDLESSIQMKALLHDGMVEAQRLNFEAWLRTKPYVKEFHFVSSDSAAAILLEKTGEDVREMLDGFNPLPDAYNLQLEAKYMQADSLSKIRQELRTYRLVSDVDFPMAMIEQLRRNLRVISVVLAAVGLVMLGVAFYLIFSTIRLAIFARRLAIRSMQLIGATEAFIRRPFLWTGVRQGFMAGSLGSFLLFWFSLSMEGYVASIGPSISVVQRPDFIGLLSGIVLLGAVLGWSGSYLAVNRYLGRNLDQLM